MRPNGFRSLSTCKFYRTKKYPYLKLGYIDNTFGRTADIETGPGGGWGCGGFRGGGGLQVSDTGGALYG